MKLIFKIFQILVSTSLLFYLFQKYSFSLDFLWDSSLNIEWFFLSIFCSIIAIQFFAGIRWQRFLSILKINERLHNLIRINFVSIFWGIFLPSADGFALIRLYLLAKKMKSKYAEVTGSLILEKVNGLIILLITCLIASFFIESSKYLGVLQYILIGLNLCWFVIIIISLKKRILNILINKLDGKGKIRLFLFNLFSSISKIKMRQLFIAVPFVILVQILCYLTTYCLFIMFDQDISFRYHLCFLPVIQLITLIPISISAFGVREGAFVFFYQDLGIDPSLLISISILNYIIHAVFPALIGGIIVIVTKIKPDFRKQTDLK